MTDPQRISTELVQVLHLIYLIVSGALTLLSSAVSCHSGFHQKSSDKLNSLCVTFTVLDSRQLLKSQMSFSSVGGDQNGAYRKGDNSSGVTNTKPNEC